MQSKNDPNTHTHTGIPRELQVRICRPELDKVDHGKEESFVRQIGNSRAKGNVRNREYWNRNKECLWCAHQWDSTDEEQASLIFT